MNITEARKSGKPFKRKNDADDAWLIEIKSIFTYTDMDASKLAFTWLDKEAMCRKSRLALKLLSPVDMNADDWMIKED